MFVSELVSNVAQTCCFCFFFFCFLFCFVSCVTVSSVGNLKPSEISSVWSPGLLTVTTCLFHKLNLIINLE